MLTVKRFANLVHDGTNDKIALHYRALAVNRFPPGIALHAINFRMHRLKIGYDLVAKNIKK